MVGSRCVEWGESGHKSPTLILATTTEDVVFVTLPFILKTRKRQHNWYLKNVFATNGFCLWLYDKICIFLDKKGVVFSEQVNKAEEIDFTVSGDEEWLLDEGEEEAAKVSEESDTVKESKAIPKKRGRKPRFRKIKCSTCLCVLLIIF